MKTLIPVLALALVGLASPAFAVDLSGVMDQSACSEAGGVWDLDAGKCLAQDTKRACELTKGKWDEAAGACKK
jgi:hypothetical protein